jgi:AGZA family xanthine/uracil permease-like MFS transporter
VIAPALILVGTMMMPAVRTIAWDDATEGIPAFLTMIVMPLTVSITDGIAFGVISHTLLKVVTGRGREAHPLMYAFAVVFVLRYAFLVH